MNTAAGWGRQAPLRRVPQSSATGEDLAGPAAELIIRKNSYYEDRIFELFSRIGCTDNCTKLRKQSLLISECHDSNNLWTIKFCDNAAPWELRIDYHLSILLSYASFA